MSAGAPLSPRAVQYKGRGTGAGCAAVATCVAVAVGRCGGGGVRGGAVGWPSRGGGVAVGWRRAFLKGERCRKKPKAESSPLTQ